MENLKRCPFCGCVVKKFKGYGGLTFYKCPSFRCGAVVSFNNDACNLNFANPDDFWNRRYTDHA